MRLWAGLCVAALLLLPAAAHADPWILSDGPAHCVFSSQNQNFAPIDFTDGTPVPLFILNNFATPIIANDEVPRRRIAARCTRGTRTVAATLRYGRLLETYFSDCLPGEACRPSWPANGWDYPPLLRLVFDPAAAKMHPQAIVYDDGQATVIADLAQRRVWLSTRPEPPDISAQNPYVTAERAIDAAQARHLAALAAALRRPGRPDPKQCTFVTDLFGKFTVLDRGASHAYSFSLGCENPQVRALSDAIACAAEPRAHDCSAPPQHKMGTRL